MKIVTFFDKLWDWIVYSSANPAKYSGTLKWGLGLTAVLITGVLGFAHLQFPTADWTSFGDALIQGVQDILAGLTLLGTAFSLLRKMYLTVTGKNQVLITSVSTTSN